MEGNNYFSVGSFGLSILLPLILQKLNKNNVNNNNKSQNENIIQTNQSSLSWYLSLSFLSFIL